MRQLSVYLDGHPLNCRPRRIDWVLVQKMMPRVAEWAPDIRFVLQKSSAVSIRENYRIVRAAIERRLGIPADRWAGIVDRLDSKELARSGCEIVFSHRGFPLNSGDIPVVWMHAILDPEMYKSYFGSGQS